jgi:hopanoid biosynthesis associated RND transporter like protein HpnN
MIGAPGVLSGRPNAMPTSPDPPDSSIPDGEATGLRKRIVDAAAASARHPLVVIAIAVVLAALSIVYVARDFAIDTDSAKLISAKVAWRVRSAAFDAAFPRQTDLIAIVVDGATPDLAERASATLAARLAARNDLFHVVRRPDGGPFFEKNGLLFLDRDEVARTTEQLVSSQPVIGTLAADPSVRGLIETLRLALEGVKRKEASLTVLAPGLAALATTLDDVLADRPASLPWRAMLGGGAASPRELRRFVLAQPVLDYSALEPGARASDFIRRTAADAGFDAAHGVRVRLTGNIPMADEEFGTLQDHAGRNASVMLCALLGMLWLAVRSVRAVVAIFATLFVGLALTGAIGLAIYHALNLISVAFAVLFVGLGVDFGIQYAVSYRAHAVDGGGADARRLAVRRAAAQVGTSLALAALAIAAGFFAFEPTDYRGVSELGVIAGIGMVIAFVASVTLLPALLYAMRVDGLVEGMHFSALAPVDRLLQKHRRGVLAIAAGLAIASLALLPFVRFDFNPLHLRSAETEAVATILDLARDPMTTPDTIDVLAPSLDAANALAERISALPEVSHALTLSSFIPADQTAKLALIADASSILDLTLNPAETRPAPTDDEVVAALRDGARDLVQAADDDPKNPASVDARRVAAAFAALAGGTPAHRKALDEALIPGLKTTLAQLRSALGAAPVMTASLPQELVDDWIAKDGRARIEVFPKQVSGDNRANRLDVDEDAGIERFIAAVRTVAPDATGTPISIEESADTIVRAFIEAGVWALIAIATLLVVVLRKARDVAITLASLLLGGFVTLGLCVVLRIPLNYANIIALPLLFGIGVAFNIYFVIAWRHGVRDLLQTSIARAVIFSALTTSTAFGSLWLSSHPGTASMGKLLALSLACTLAAALLVLPALLGPPERNGGNGA